MAIVSLHLSSLCLSMSTYHDMAIVSLHLSSLYLSMSTYHDMAIVSLHAYVSVMVIVSRASSYPIESSGPLERNCRSGLLLSYPTIYNITRIILIS